MFLEIVLSTKYAKSSEVPVKESIFSKYAISFIDIFQKFWSDILVLMFFRFYEGLFQGTTSVAASENSLTL